MTDLIETAELVAFAKIVETQSLSRAAAELGVPRATIGRRLQRLESRLGVRLLRRTTRSLAMTDAGETLFRHARNAIEAVRAAESSVRRSDDSVRGELRVAVPPFHHPGFHALMARFATRYPEVRLFVHFSTQHVDLRRGGFDVALRGTSDLEEGLVARVLARAKAVAVASPAYLKAHGAPRTIRDLRKHRCLVGFARGELPHTHWPYRRGRKVQVEPAFASNDLAHLGELALAGAGIAYVAEPMVRDALARRALIQVLPGTLEFDVVLAIVYAEREFLPPQVRAFVDEFVAWAQVAPDGALWPPKVGERSG